MQRSRATDEDGAAGTQIHVTFEPVGRRSALPTGLTLLECARRLGVGLSAICGGHGTCGRCRVRLAEGRLTPPTSIEESFFSADELRQGMRLACQAMPTADCVVHIPPESLTAVQRTQVEGLQVTPAADPPIVQHRLTVSAPSMHDVAGDVDRIVAALNTARPGACTSVDALSLRGVSALLRAHDWTIGVSLREKELIAAGLWPSPALGLAVDVGTTKIAAYLLDLSTGGTLAARGAMNPQIQFGEDVISRLSYALTREQGAVELSRCVVQGINALVEELAEEAGKDPNDILEVVIAGNTAMHHLLLGLPVGPLSRAPYVPALSDAIDVKARELGLLSAPGAYVHFLANVAGFVGGDHVAMLTAIGIQCDSGPALAIDIGTNTEVCLASHGTLTSVSCASGPAFEGGHIRDGMRAAPGAIEHVSVARGEVHLEVIDSVAPVGICGSGILDALAELVRDGAVDAAGRLDTNHPRVVGAGSTKEFVLVSQEERGGGAALGITQGDIRQLQLAKAAIATGIETLLRMARLKPDDLSSVIIAGAFGSYIDVGSAIGIGMLPPLPLSRFRQVGNAAGAGAKLVLSSCSTRRSARELARRIGYIELAATDGFMQQFVRHTYLNRWKELKG